MRNNKPVLLCISVVLLSFVEASPTGTNINQTNDVTQPINTSNTDNIAAEAPNNTNLAPANDTANPAQNATQVTENGANNANNTTAAAADTAASSEEEEDDALPEGMSESLADFVMDMLKGGLKNATQKLEGSPKPESAAVESAANATQSQSSDTLVPNATNTENAAADQSAANTPIISDDQQTTSWDDDDDDYFDDEYYNYDDDDYDDDEYDEDSYDDDDWGTSSQEVTSTTKEPFSKGGKANCNVEVDLNNYCIVDELVNVYFHGDLTAKGLRDPLFDMDIVERLKSCPRGEWCLGNELDTFRAMQDRFTQGPLCEESLWECVFDIMVQREDCPDKEFMFVVDAVDLMCELLQEPPYEENEQRCFAHTLAALHVTYADFLANNMTTVAPETSASCDGYGFRMTKTYLCADGSCDDLFEARIAMEQFGRWSWFMKSVEDRVIECNMGDVDTCGALRDSQTATERVWFGMTSESYWDDYTTPPGSYSDDYPQSDSHNGAMDLENRTAEEDESLMMALSVASAVGLLFMVLGLIFWRRSRRRNLMYYRGDAYGKLSADEGPLLSRSSE